MDKKSGKVIYRRVHGRVIPIRVKEGAEGLGKIGLGTGIALGTSYGAGVGLKKVIEYGNKVKASTISSALAFDPTHATTLGRKISAMNIQRGAKSLKTAKNIAFLSKSAIWGGRLIGAGLIAAGTEKLVRAATGADNKDRALRFGATLSGFAAGFGALSAFTAGYDKELAAKLIRKVALKK